MTDDNDREKYNDNNVAGAFVHSFGHMVIQGPIDGIREIVNTCAEKEIVPKIQIVQEPEKSNFGTPAWQAQQFAKGAGAFAILIGVARLLRGRF